MELERALALGRELLDRHGLGEWSVELDRAKRRAGCCRYAERRITISRHLTVLHDEVEVEETLLHEIAHALVGPRHGHDAVWRRTAQELGATGERCLSEDSPAVETPWVGTCPAGHITGRHRRPTRPVSCVRCSPTFSLDHLYTWHLHGREADLGPDYAAALARSRHAGGRGDGGTGTGGTGTGTGGETTTRGPVEVGETVVVGGVGRYAGAVGTVVKRGRTRYHVRVDGGVLTVPFTLARPAGRGTGTRGAHDA